MLLSLCQQFPQKSHSYHKYLRKPKSQFISAFGLLSRMSKKMCFFKFCIELNLHPKNLKTHRLRSLLSRCFQNPLYLVLLSNPQKSFFTFSLETIFEISKVIITDRVLHIFHFWQERIVKSARLDLPQRQTG